MTEKCQVVMLPTEKVSNHTLWLTNINQLINTHISGEYLNKYKAHHLYILSDEEIKKGDWAMYTKGNKVHYKQLFDKGDIELANINDSGVKKIIATTDKSLGYTDHRVSPVPNFCDYPQISKQFIQKYIEEYNKGNIIIEVMVEYYFTHETGYDKPLSVKLDTDNNIIIIN